MEPSIGKSGSGVVEIDGANPRLRGRIGRAVLGASGVERLRAAVENVDFFRFKNLDRSGRANQQQLSRFSNTHRGQTGVIIGNGPSLRHTDLQLLRGVPTFGLNRIYLMFDELGFATTYHVVVNRLIVEQYTKELDDLAMPKFTSRPNMNLFSGERRPLALQPLHGLGFSRDATRGIWEGATVTYVAMQLAYYMGFSRVVLIGVDHNFGVKGPAHKVVETVQKDTSHFHPDYFGKGIKWQLPDLETSEASYRLANAAYLADGRQILDATVGGALDVFPKVSLADALRDSAPKSA